MISIVVAADLHIHAFSPFTVRGNPYSRLQDQVEVLKWIANTVKEEAKQNAAYFVNLGDVFENANPLSGRVVKPYLQFANTIRNHVKKHIIVAGNHDRAHLESIVNVLGEVPGIDLITKNKHGDVGVPCDFLPWGCKQEGQCDGGLSFGHYGLRGAVMGSDYVSKDAEFTTDNLRLENYRAVFIGHYHKFQKVADNAWYVGSPLQINMGERGQEKKIAVVRIQDDDMEIEWKVNDFSSQMVQFDNVNSINMLQGNHKNNYVRVISPLSRDNEEYHKIDRWLIENTKAYELQSIPPIVIAQRMNVDFSDDLSHIIEETLKYKQGSIMTEGLNMETLNEIGKDMFE